MDTTPRLFTNECGSMFQYPDSTGKWRWGVLKHSKQNKMLSMDLTANVGESNYLPPNWVCYALVADAVD